MSLEGVKAAVDDAQKVYESRGRKSKIRQYLGAFSSRVMYYGAVMDTLSQHHPEFVSLAWGAVKFLFVVRPFTRLHTYLCPPVFSSIRSAAQNPGTRGELGHVVYDLILLSGPFELRRTPHADCENFDPHR